ncbi:MAG: 50S ribosomal protein L34 [Planctomycetes bacterium]|nr:50S ribosomal protein L34 [Planctomycetota bacterium]
MKVKIRKSSRKRIKMCGFRKRMRTRGGRAILNRRRRIGREFNTSLKNKGRH